MITRRAFLEAGGRTLAVSGLAVGGAVPLHAAESATPRPQPVDYYDKLGVAKIINAAGTYTYLTASLMPAEVQEAVAFAAKHPVRLRDLQKAAGEYIAQKLQ